jgi:hypothetical protein
MSKRRVLIAGFVLAALVGGSLAAVALRDGGEEPSVGAPETKEGVETRVAPTRTAPPEKESSGPIRFVLADRYVAGETVDVLIENVGRRTFLFQPYYQACFLKYFHSSGRRFIIPPGTHCDILAEVPIRPGETKNLFTWKLDECLKDRWGCMKSRSLPPGTYTIRGRFKPEAAGAPARAETTFTIIAAS